jgi:sterol desaturase/sphingolipid hydroxylase (fatty acid hydroxylase superfamily)
VLVPSLFDLIVDPVSLSVLALYVAMSCWERLRPARVLPRVPHWQLRGLAAFAVYFLISSYLPFLVQEPLARLSLFDGRSLGTLGGGLLAYVLYEFLLYLWHRALHEFDALFLSFHQLHHSAERVDVSGAFWFSPLDMIGFTLVSLLALSFVLVTPQAGTLFLLLGSFSAVFQHANLRTPHWLGYVIQRPEMHALHHARGAHRNNYSDLPLFDMLFGTYENPREFAGENGYYPGASSRILAMLLCKDVSRPEEHSALVRSGRDSRAASAGSQSAP